MKAIGQKYTYYCGANLVIKLLSTNTGVPVLIGECAAIQYQLSQNRLPLYGYNAPEFSAVADGQIIVNGRLHLNYVTHEYLLAAIRTSNLTINSNSEYQNMTDEELQYLITTANDTRAIEALKEKYWGSTNNKQGQFNTDLRSNFGRPDQHTMSLDIKLEFGDQTLKNSTCATIKHVYFLGRAKTSQISEDPESETFDFLARTII